MRFAHVRFELPPLGLMVPPRGPARCFCCGARLARGGAPAKEGGEVAPRPPLLRARSLPPPQSAANVTVNVQPLLHVQTVSPRRQASRAPPSASRPSAARSAQACPTLGSAESTGKPFPRASVEALSCLPHEHRARHGCSHRGRRRPTCSQPRPALCSTPHPRPAVRHGLSP